LEIRLISSLNRHWLRHDGASILLIYIVVLFVFARVSELVLVLAIWWGVALLSGTVAVLLGFSLLVNQVSFSKIKWLWLAAIPAIGFNLAMTQHRLYAKSAFTIFVEGYNLVEIISTRHPFWSTNVVFNGIGAAAIMAATCIGLSLGGRDNQKIFRYMCITTWLVLLPALIWIDIHSRLLTAWPTSNPR
jgi:hypothetical protein